MSPSSAAVFSVFASAYETTPAGETSLEHFIGQIRSGIYSKAISKVRTGEMEKEKLAAASLSGTFTVRSSAGLKAHSGLLQIDIDAKDNPGVDMAALQQSLKSDPYCVAAFKSAKGQGLKVVVRIDGSRHRESAVAAAEYFKVIHGVVADPSCKDVSRLCFVSDDPEAWVKPPDERNAMLPLPADGAGALPPGTKVTPDKRIVYNSVEEEAAAIQRVEEVLDHIPTRPPYPTWLIILSGVFDELPYHHAVAALNAWSPEEDENEYEKKYSVRLKEIGFGSVMKMAIAGGYDNSPAKRRERAVRKLPDLSGVKDDDGDITGGGAAPPPGDPDPNAGAAGDGAAGRSSADGAAESKPRPRITRLPDHIVAVRKMPHFVDGLLTPSGFSLWYGRTNTGKSFLLQDLAAAIAAGRGLWRNGEIEIVGGGPVVYCALEGGYGAENRMLALKSRGLLKDGDPFGLVTIPVRLLEKGIKRGAMVICDAIKEMQDDFGTGVKFVVIDTWARATAGGGEENSNSDALMAVAQCDEVRDACRSAALAAVHHAGKDETKGSRGASALPDACDTEVEIYKPEGSDISTAIVRKQRDMEFRKPMPFRLEQVVVGADYRGRPVTSCVVVHLRSEEGTVRGAGGKSGGAGRPDRMPVHQILSLLPQSSMRAWKKAAEERFGVSKTTFYRKLDELEGKDRYETQSDGNIIAKGSIYGFGDNNGGE